MSTRKISYKQVLTNKDTILSMPATDGIKKQFTTFVKMSPANLKQAGLGLNYTFIAEAVEYSLNPYQLENVDRLAANIYEINLYN